MNNEPPAPITPHPPHPCRWPNCEAPSSFYARDNRADFGHLFLADMGTRPSGHTLDRRRTGDGYRRKNCRWATPKTQARNRRSTRLTRKTATLIRHLRRQGKTYDELARTFGVKRGTINDVISRRTWT